ncbi:putative inner membrane protein [Trabulsiella guamensis ATCC 49490]|uniref:Putative inner membrane protein n=1 Tax=Trabulsiella guamensis ATCC 49490 TaxID=1005994 RepID=A0A084ZP98_9ENTR|nr:putative inner membrane protein [Trabulsiella guamensis ATCC 49490]
MKKWNLVLSLLVALCVMFFAIRYNVNNSTSTSPSTCTVRYTSVKGNIQLHTIVYFFFNSHAKKGEIILDGEIYNQDLFISNLHRKISFQYHMDMNNISLTSEQYEKMNEDDTDDVNLKDHLSPFYLVNHKSTNISIQKQGPNAYIFYEGPIPLFYCLTK